MRVLIAEDERELNGIIAKRLADEDYAVDSVYDGKSALEYMLATRYDVILLDVMMPQLDGFEVLRRYREEGGSSPVLFLTARDAVSDRVRGLDSGADDYLVKPFSFQELLARIRVMLQDELMRLASADPIVLSALIVDADTKEAYTLFRDMIIPSRAQTLWDVELAGLDGVSVLPPRPSPIRGQ